MEIIAKYTIYKVEHYDDTKADGCIGAYYENREAAERAMKNNIYTKNCDLYKIDVTIPYNSGARERKRKIGSRK